MLTKQSITYSSDTDHQFFDLAIPRYPEVRQHHARTCVAACAARRRRKNSQQQLCECTQANMPSARQIMQMDGRVMMPKRRWIDGQVQTEHCQAVQWMHISLQHEPQFHARCRIVLSCTLPTQHPPCLSRRRQQQCGRALWVARKTWRRLTMPSHAGCRVRLTEVYGLQNFDLCQSMEYDQRSMTAVHCNMQSQVCKSPYLNVSLYSQYGKMLS